MRILFSIGVLLAGSVGAFGQPATTQPPLVANNRAIAAEFTTAFSSICLDAFPESAAVDNTLTQKGAVPMTQEQLSLLDNPTGGWFIKGTHTSLAILVRTKPVRSCAVRLTTPGLFSPGAMYAALEAVFAAQKGLKLQPATLLVREPSDHYATIITNETVKPDGSKGGHVFQLTKDYFADPKDPKNLLSLDTQLVHQILSPD